MKFTREDETQTVRFEIRPAATAAAGEAEPARKEAEDGDAEADAEEDNRRDDGVEDLGDAGEDYLEQQGFDRRS